MTPEIDTLQTPSGDREYWHTSSGLFLAMVGLIGSYQGMFNILLPATVERLNPAGKVHDFAILTTTAAVVTVIGLIIGGAISDRTRTRWGQRTPTILFSGIASVALMVALGAAHPPAAPGRRRGPARAAGCGGCARRGGPAGR